MVYFISTLQLHLPTLFPKFFRVWIPNPTFKSGWQGFFRIFHRHLPWKDRRRRLGSRKSPWLHQNSIRSWFRNQSLFLKPKLNQSCFNLPYMITKVRSTKWSNKHLNNINPWCLNLERTANSSPTAWMAVTPVQRGDDFRQFAAGRCSFRV